MTVEKINSYSVTLSKEEIVALSKARGIIENVLEEMDNRDCDYVLCGEYEECEELFSTQELINVKDKLDWLEDILEFQMEANIKIE